MANPIAASAAATVKINSVNICPLKSLINIEKAVKEVTSLNSGLKGICRSTIMRILNLKVAPPHLK